MLTQNDAPGIRPCQNMGACPRYGLRIKDLRDERGLSQRGFAALIGMSPTYLADIERGARNVSIDNMKRIADGFGVTFHEMTEGME